MSRDPDTIEVRSRRGKMYSRDSKLAPGDFRGMVNLLEGGMYELRLQCRLLSHVNLTTGDDPGPAEYYVLAQAVNNMIDEVDLLEARFEELLHEVFVLPSEEDLK